jgi:hypothetical protein
MAQGNTWQDPQGRASLTYPATWVNNATVVQQMRQVFPGYALSVADPATQCGIEIIFFDGQNDPAACANYISGVFQQLGMQVQIGQPQRNMVGGKQSYSVPVMIAGPTGQVGGVMNFMNISTGIVAVNVGGPPQGLQAGMKDIGQVLNSVRLK